MTKKTHVLKKHLKKIDRNLEKAFEESKPTTKNGQKDIKTYVEANLHEILPTEEPFDFDIVISDSVQASIKTLQTIR